MKTQRGNHPPVVDQARGGLGSNMRETAAHFRETMARAGEGLQESLGNMGTRLNDTRHVVVDKTKKYAKTTNKYVNKNPWGAMGIAAGLAFLAGFVIARRRGGDTRFRSHMIN